MILCSRAVRLALLGVKAVGAGVFIYRGGRDKWRHRQPLEKEWRTGFYLLASGVAEGKLVETTKPACTPHTLSFTEYLIRFWRQDVQTESLSVVKPAVEV